MTSKTRAITFIALAWLAPILMLFSSSTVVVLSIFIAGAISMAIGIYWAWQWAKERDWV